jgi:hypothetical protein
MKNTSVSIISEYATARQANQNLLNPFTPIGRITRFGPVITPVKNASSSQPQIDKADIKDR